MDAVVGRDHELETVSSFLDSAKTRPRVLVLEGEPGMGKTTLWRAAVEEARARGYGVLSCAAIGSEAKLSFTAIHDLLDDSFDEVADVLAPPQRRALSVTLLREEPEGPPPEQGAIALGLLTSLRVLAARAPTALAVDDAHWLDAASAYSTAAFKKAFARLYVILHGGPLPAVNAHLRQLGLPPVRATAELAENPYPMLRVVWNPQGYGSPDIPGNSAQAYYPGDKYVDVVGDDLYLIRGKAEWEAAEKLYAAPTPASPSPFRSGACGGSTTRRSWRRWPPGFGRTGGPR